MNLKTVKKLLAALGAAAILVGIVVSQINPMAAVLLAMIPLAAFFIILLKFWRCPHCRAPLGRPDNRVKFCPSCGRRLDDLQ